MEILSINDGNTSYSIFIELKLRLSGKVLGMFFCFMVFCIFAL